MRNDNGLTFPFHPNDQWKPAQPMRPMRETPKRPRKPIDRLPTMTSDGGRAASGLPMQGRRGDCVTRAIAITTGLPYAQVWKSLIPFACKGNPDKGVYTHTKVYAEFMRGLGFTYTSCLSPTGRSGRVKLRKGDLPKGRLLVRTKRHAQAVIDGVVHDTAATATACVRGYWTLEPGRYAQPVQTPVTP